MQQVIQRLVAALQRSLDLLLNTQSGRVIGVTVLVLVVLVFLTRRVVKLFRKQKEANRLEAMELDVEMALIQNESQAKLQKQVPITET